jgi:uncharacterized protein (DUF488 family)
MEPGPRPDAVVVHSIGHSNHLLEEFVALLRQHGIIVLVDIRSQPYSRWTPQYNRETLARALEQGGIRYLFMGDALGGRPADPSLYHAAADDEAHGPRPDYQKMAALPAFQEGLHKLIELAAQYPLAMMCSEGDHEHCHRTLLITPHLLAHGVRVMHIQPDGSTVQAEEKPKQLSMF